MCKQLILNSYQSQTHKILRLGQNVMALFCRLPHPMIPTSPHFFILLLNCSCQYLHPLVLIQNSLYRPPNNISVRKSQQCTPELLGERLWGTEYLHNAKVSPHKPLIKRIIVLILFLIYFHNGKSGNHHLWWSNLASNGHSVPPKVIEYEVHNFTPEMLLPKMFYLNRIRPQT